MFPPESFTPLEKIVEVVLMLLNGDGKQANGTGVEKPLIGQIVEVNCQNHYFRKQHDFCDDVIAAIYG